MHKPDSGADYAATIGAAFAQTAVAIIICDTGFAPLFLNAAARRMLGLDADASMANLAPGWFWNDATINRQSVEAMIERDGSWRGTVTLCADNPAASGRGADVDISAFQTDATAGFVVVARHAAANTLLGRRASEIDRVSRSRHLSAREKEVVLGLLDGLSNKSIALKMAISPRTVEFHRARLMLRFKARSLVDLIRNVVHDEGVA